MRASKFNDYAHHGSYPPCVLVVSPTLVPPSRSLGSLLMNRGDSVDGRRRRPYPYMSGPNCGRVVTASLATDVPPPRHLNSYFGSFWWCSNPYRSSGDIFFWRCAAAAVMAATAAATLCTTHTTSNIESTSPWFHVRRNSGIRSAKSTTATTTQCCGIVGVVGGGVSEESDSNIPPLDTRYVTSGA
jgi:hypothetical protein